MKKLLIILFSLGVVASASAQRVGHGGYYGHGFYRPPTVIVGGGFYASPWGYPYFPYYGPSYGYYSRPSKLDMQLEEIRSDYKDKIWSVKQDDSLTRKERRNKVRELKKERDNVLSDAKKNYYKR